MVYVIMLSKELRGVKQSIRRLPINFWL